MSRVTFVYSYYPLYKEHKGTKFLRVATSLLLPRDALMYYLLWLEGDCSYETGRKRGTDIPIIETKRHYYFKRNNVITFVRK